MTELRPLLIGDYDVVLANGDVQYGRFHSLAGLNELFRSNGVAAQWPTYDLREPRPINEVDKLQRMLKRASAVFAPGACGIFDNDLLVDLLHARLKEGLRIWVTVPQIHPDHADERSLRLSRFLESHGIRPTLVGVFSATPEFDHPRSFLVRRADNPRDFRDAQLFRGVEELLFQQAHGLLLYGEAYSMASIRPNDYKIVDMDADVFTDWNEPEISLIATTYVGAKGGCILCTSGLVVSDPYLGPVGHSFPGLEKNAPVIQNIIQTLLSSALSNAASIDVEVHRLLQRIERNLLETIRSVFSAKGADWGNFVADQAQKKAKDRAMLERNKLPWMAYLDLADHLNTITKNRDAFVPFFASLGLPTSNSKIRDAVFHVGELIRLRILDAHVTKRHVMEHEFSDKDLDLLKDIDRNVIRLWRSATGVQSLA